MKCRRGGLGELLLDSGFVIYGVEFVLYAGLVDFFFFSVCDFDRTLSSVFLCSLWVCLWYSLLLKFFFFFFYG